MLFAGAVLVVLAGLHALAKRRGGYGFVIRRRLSMIQFHEDVGVVVAKVSEAVRPLATGHFEVLPGSRTIVRGSTQRTWRRRRDEVEVTIEVGADGRIAVCVTGRRPIWLAAMTFKWSRESGLSIRAPRISPMARRVLTALGSCHA